MRFNESSIGEPDASVSSPPDIRCEPLATRKGLPARRTQARERDGRPGPVKLNCLVRVAQARLDAARESPCCGVARLPPLSSSTAMCEPHQSENSTRGRTGDDAHWGRDEGAIKQVCYAPHRIAGVNSEPFSAKG